MTLELEEAKKVLERCKRLEVRDHAFGDAEIYWTDSDGDERGFCYLCGFVEVSVYEKGSTETLETFKGPDARELLKCGTLEVYRNDETGPDEFVEGQTMDALTLEGVRRELTGGR